MKKQLELKIPEATSLEELEALMEEIKNANADIEARLNEAKKAKKAEAISEIVKTIKDAGLTIYDLMEAFGVQAQQQHTAAKILPKKAPAPPKFKNPTTGETHSGRGQLPAWLKEARDTGKLEEFRIK